MLFNSYPFIFLFLPIALVVYFVLNKKKLVTAGKVWLAFSSVAFYGYWNWKFVALLLASVCVNYAMGAVLLGCSRATEEGKRFWRSELSSTCWFWDTSSMPTSSSPTSIPSSLPTLEPSD